MPESRGSVRMRLKHDEAEIINNYRRIREEAEKEGVDPTSVTHGWIKNKNASLFFKTPIIDQYDRILEAFSDLCGKYTFNKDKFRPEKVDNIRAIKATCTDDHIGLDVNADNTSIFNYEYSPAIYKESFLKFTNSIYEKYDLYGRFDLCFIDNLGDQQDGLNGQTTRGGHDLPQNAGTEEVFYTCVDTKIELIDNLIKDGIANKFTVRSVVNDNHSGDFGLLINLAIKKIIEMKYGQDIIQIDILKRFLEHRTYGNHCFILTHGKDKSKRKYGFPKNLNQKAIEIIDDYISHHNLIGLFCHLEKGDLHTSNYERTNRFDYRNYMAFSPPSEWIQHNFGDNYAGYAIQVIDKNVKKIEHTEYDLNYRVKR